MPSDMPRDRWHVATHPTIHASALACPLHSVSCENDHRWHVWQVANMQHQEEAVGEPFPQVAAAQGGVFPVVHLPHVTTCHTCHEPPRRTARSASYSKHPRYGPLPRGPATVPRPCRRFPDHRVTGGRGRRSERPSDGLYGYPWVFSGASGGRGRHEAMRPRERHSLLNQDRSTAARPWTTV